MQLTQLFRRGIVVPLDDEAEAELQAHLAPDLTHVVFLPIKGDDDFYAIWHSGIFSALNEACGSYIDDYEETFLEPEVLEAAILVLLKQFASLATESLRQFRDSLLALLIDARERNRPVGFVF